MCMRNLIYEEMFYPANGLSLGNSYCINLHISKLLYNCYVACGKLCVPEAFFVRLNFISKI
jgi:hypothetical protein